MIESFEEFSASAPLDTRIYAVGDIHGRVDLLRHLHGLIEADAARPGVTRNTVIYLGDYVDRGAESAAVIDLILDAPPRGCGVVTLKGNHEELMLRFRDDISVARGWLMNGGDTTLASYGVDPPLIYAGAPAFEQAQAKFAASLPPRHLAFLEQLALTHVAGDYLFVHAGIRPGVKLADQRADDLLWIRDKFLDSYERFEKFVVHGHSITLNPAIRANRIGIDTGAYASGRLTCLVLEGRSRRFIST
jgi:serine/threonine protein phosphatase 1